MMATRKAAKEPLPVSPKCAACDDSRHVELPDGRVARCTSCHPLSPRSLIALLDERARLVAEIERVDEEIAEAEAAADAPEWARGPRGVAS